MLSTQNLLTDSLGRSVGLPENNLGQLFWQLNAPWTTLSLNSIEYTERWKVLQYVAGQVFHRVAVSSWIEPTNTTFNLWVVSDSWEPVSGTVTATWMTWAGDILNTTEYPFTLSELNSTALDERTGWSQILPNSAKSSDAVLLLNLTAHSNVSTFMNQNFLVPHYLSNARLVDPGLKLSKVEGRTWRVEASWGVAAYVWLSHPIGVTGYFDQNAVFLAKGETRDFKFTVLKDTTDGAWEASVRVRSMWDNWEI